MKIHLNYVPKEVQLTEDIVACLTSSQAHVFKVKLEEATEDKVVAGEKPPRSMSLYSFRCVDIPYLRPPRHVYVRPHVCLWILFHKGGPGGEVRTEVKAYLPSR